MTFQRILVTGSSGVLGRAVQSASEGRVEAVFARRVDCDLTKHDETLAYVQGVEPDAIIHLAAMSGGIALSRKHPATLLRTNTLMTLNILEAARNAGVQKTVLTLSSGMYPPGATQPYKEDAIHAGDAHETNFGYSHAKRLMEPAIRAYRDEFGMTVIGLVPNALFGPFDKFDSPDATFIASLVARFCRGRRSDEDLVVWGDGSPLRELTYSLDAANAFLWCLDNYDSGQILNIGNTEELSIRDVAIAIAQTLDIDLTRIVFDKTKPAGVPRKSTSNDRFLALSGFRYTPFRQSLKATIDWYLAN